jgi:bifunctional oligoribonuclease and PAP phosphatase NrnA
VAVAGRRVTAAEAADRLRKETHVLIVSHESPDGDALGCLSAFALVCERLGIPYVSYVPGNAPFPAEYEFLPRLHGVVRGSVPVVGPETTVYMLDCASLSRGGCQLFGEGTTLVTIDHHQDNPGNADLNLLVPEAASTSAILYDIFRAGHFPIDVQIAASLYVGLVTDTGRFQYSNTNAHAHRMAAELQEVGVDVAAIARQVYESVPLPKLRLLGIALEHLEVKQGGLVVMSWLRERDFAAAGANDSHAEGIIDTLRQIKGTVVAVLAREKMPAVGLETKVSLRSMDGKVDVAAIAGLKGGGGHKQAAGFTTAGDVQEVLEWTLRQFESVL